MAWSFRTAPGCEWVGRCQFRFQGGDVTLLLPRPDREGLDLLGQDVGCLARDLQLGRTCLSRRARGRATKCTDSGLELLQQNGGPVGGCPADTCLCGEVCDGQAAICCGSLTC